MAFIRYDSTTADGDWHQITSVHKDQALANAGSLGNMAYVGAVSDDVDPGYWIDITDGTVAKVVPSSDSAALAKMKSEAIALHRWLIDLHTGLDFYGQYYEDRIRRLGHDALVQIHRGIYIVLNRAAPSVKDLSIEKRTEFVQKMGLGMADARTAQEFYPVAVKVGIARAQARLEPTLRIPVSPIVWADPRTSPVKQIKLAHVIDFSGVAGYMEDGITTTGLGLTPVQASLSVDYSKTDWINEIRD